MIEFRLKVGRFDNVVCTYEKIKINRIVSRYSNFQNYLVGKSTMMSIYVYYAVTA